jgi:hypothetical protein
MVLRGGLMKHASSFLERLQNQAGPLDRHQGAAPALMRDVMGSLGLNQG